MNKVMMMAAMMAAAWMPASTMAGDFNFRLDIGGRKGHVGVGVHAGDHVGVGVHVGRARPVAVTRTVYVPAEYALVSERVWVPTTQTVYREVPVLDANGQVVAYRQEPQVIESGYWTTVQKQVLVREGYTKVVEHGRRYPARGVHTRVVRHAAY